MTRVFRRGELKPALLAIVASLGEGHGYAIMQELQERVGNDWRPSPGAIYPALLALEQSGLLESTDRDALRTYRVTTLGHRTLDSETEAPAWQTLAERAGSDRPRQTLGVLLERFELRLPPARQPLSDEQAAAVFHTLEDAGDRIMTALDQGVDDG
jgi:DNA-binding PadR family transcriptional regulator